MKKHGNIVLPSLLRVTASGAIDGIDKTPFQVYNDAATVGYANAFPDKDGIIRSFVASTATSDSFALSIAKKSSPDIFLPEKNAKILIDYRSKPYDRYRVVSFYKAYNGIWEDYNGEKVDIRGKNVLIGDYDESL